MKRRGGRAVLAAVAAAAASRAGPGRPPPSPCLLERRAEKATLPTRRLFHTSPSRAQAVPATAAEISATAAPVQSAIAEADHLHLRALFDAPRASTSASASGKEKAGASSPSGLFLHPSLSAPEDMLALAQRTLLRAQLLVSRIVAAPDNGPAEMRQVVLNLDRLSDLLCGVIDCTELLRNAHPDPYWAEASNAAYEFLCGYMNELNTHTGLYRALSLVVADKSLASSLSTEAHAVALVFLRDFEKSGIHLSSSHHKRFVELSDEILVLGRAFLQEAGGEESGSSSTDISGEQVRSIPLDWLAGTPPNLLTPLQHSSGVRNGKLYLSPQTWEAQTVLKYAPDARAREVAYRVNNSGTREQVATLERLLKARSELADLTEHGKSYARMALADKMAKRPENVTNFLRALSTHHRPTAQRTLDVLRALKAQHLGTKTLPSFEPWDRDFYSDLHVRSLSSPASSMPISTFFSVGTVFAGLSRMFERLYGMRLKAVQTRPGEVWDDDVQRMDVLEERPGGEVVVGTIYADLYNRPGKPPSAAHYTVRCSRRTDADDPEGDLTHGVLPDGRNIVSDPSIRTLADAVPDFAQRDASTGKEYQLPIVVLLCDFQRPTASSGPSLMGWRDVDTLFHEMGHAVHSMVGRTDYHNVSGTRCATDFVELPSILMEHFVSSPEVLALVARHHGTGRALPYEDLRAHLRPARSLDALDTQNQILLASLDQAYHSPRAGERDFDSTRELEALTREHGVVRPADDVPWQTHFGHLFGYGATYYSYLFDRAIASRVWAHTFARDPLDREAGERFKQDVLRHGGGRDPWCMLAELLGDEGIANGDEEAMMSVGRWGIADVEDTSRSRL